MARRTGRHAPGSWHDPAEPHPQSPPTLQPSSHILVACTSHLHKNTSRCRLPWCAARRSAARPSPSALPASRCGPPARRDGLSSLRCRASRRGGPQCAGDRRCSSNSPTSPCCPSPPLPPGLTAVFGYRIAPIHSLTVPFFLLQARANTKFVVQAYKVTLKTPSGEQVHRCCCGR